MKTTIEISDSLFAEARRVAQRERRSLRALVEEGLRYVVGQRKGRRSRFQLRKASYRGEGLKPEVEPGSWEEIRRRVYEGRGE
jgi:hypothetical protein